MQSSVENIKVALVGKKTVGKSLLFARITGSKYNNDNHNFDFKSLNPKDSIRLRVFDIVGEQRENFERNQSNNSDIVVFVFNINDRKSFQAFSSMKSELSAVKPYAQWILVGTHEDERIDTSVSVEEAENLAKEYGMPYIRFDTLNANSPVAVTKQLYDSATELLAKQAAKKSKLMEKIVKFENELSSDEKKNTHIIEIIAILKKALDEPIDKIGKYYQDNEKEITNHLKGLRGTRKSVLNTIVNFFATLFGTPFVVLAYKLGIVKSNMLESNQLKTGNPFMFMSGYGEKQRTKKLIHELKNDMGNFDEDDTAHKTPSEKL